MEKYIRSSDMVSGAIPTKSNAFFAEKNFSVNIIFNSLLTNVRLLFHKKKNQIQI
jgi:hypothetical protein